MLSTIGSRAGLVAAVAALAAAGLAGCGGGSKPQATNPPAQPYSKRSTVPDNVARVMPKDYAQPIATYKRYVRRELHTMLGEAGGLRAAIARHDLAGARAAWLRADARYESSGAAYGAFGDLDAAVNGGPDGLTGGIRNPDFTGLHRIELALWQRHSTHAAAAPAAQLVRDVQRLRAAVAKMEIDPLEYSLRAHEILEDGIHLQLSGRASPWSGSALVALRAEVRGTKVVLATLAPMIARRDSGGALPQARKALTRLSTALSGLERPDGTLPRWDGLGQRDRELVDGLAAGAAEQLAYVPELIDPRPARPAQRAFGDAG
jgi:iron uptake system EfeUOB component EfeO/EfeM